MVKIQNRGKTVIDLGYKYIGACDVPTMTNPTPCLHSHATGAGRGNGLCRHTHHKHTMPGPSIRNITGGSSKAPYTKIKKSWG